MKKSGSDSFTLQPSVPLFLSVMIGLLSPGTIRKHMFVAQLRIDEQRQNIDAAGNRRRNRKIR